MCTGCLFSFEWRSVSSADPGGSWISLGANYNVCIKLQSSACISVPNTEYYMFRSISEEPHSHKGQNKVVEMNDQAGYT